MPETSVITYRTWFAYGMGHVFNDLCSSVWFTYALLFFNSVLEFEKRPSLAGIAIAIGQVADGISTPMVGILSDKRGQTCCKYGRRKMWHLIGTVCVFCSFPFIFSQYYGFHNLSIMEQLIYYSVFIIVFQFGWACSQISHLSLAPDLTSVPHERTSLFAIRYSFTVLSNIVVYVIFFLVLHSSDCCNNDVIGPKALSRFEILAYVIVILGGITSTIFHIGVKENNGETDSEQLIDFRPSTRRISSLFRDSNLYIVCVVYISTRLFCNLSQMYIPYYIHTYLKLPSTNLAIFPLIMYSSSFATSTFIKEINVEFGRKITYAIGVLIGIGACLWLHFGRNKDTFYTDYEIYGVVIAFGSAGAILLVTSLSIVADLIGNDTNNGAFVYGIMSFGDKICNGLAVLAIEAMKVNYCTFYYREALTLSGLISVIVGLIAILCIKFPAREPARTENNSVAEES